MQSQERELLSCEGIIGETRTVYNTVNINIDNGRMEFDALTGLPKSLIWGRQRGEVQCQTETNSPDESGN